MSRQKKYKMKAIPSAISEKGGFTAQFIGDGYSVDARKEILPNTIKDNGVQVGEGVAWDLIQSFLKNCAAHAAATGETVTVGSLISFGLAIRGWFANKDSKASKENMRNAYSVAMSELDTEVDATVKVTLADGSRLSHNVAIGE